MLNVLNYTDHIKRLVRLNVTVIALFGLFASMVLLAHKKGAFDIELDLKSEERLAYMSAIQDGLVSADLKTTPRGSELDCKLTLSEQFSMCGINLRLLDRADVDPDNISVGMDLRNYDRLEIDLNYISPRPTDQVRLSFRTYDESISDTEDWTSLKYNSIVYAPQKMKHSLNIPFNAFKVEDWWLRDFNIPFEKATVDFSNVVWLDITSHNPSKSGEYRIQVNSAKLYGKLIPQSQLFEILFILGLFIILWLSIHQGHLMAEASKQDILTKLYNRRGASEIIGAICKRKVKERSYLFYFDIDGFKAVNDTHGHQVGDELLLQISSRVSDLLKQIKGVKSMTFARLGGDEFCVFLRDIPPKLARDNADHIVNIISEPFKVNHKTIKVGASLGLVEAGTYHNDFDSLLDEADMAMYLAKKEGKNQVKEFDDAVKQVIRDNKNISNAVKKALDENNFNLVYMPIVESKTGNIVKSEVLLRTKCPELLAVGTEKFIHIAEDFGMVESIDMWVIKEAFEFIKRNEERLRATNLKTSINVSAKEMSNQQFCGYLQSTIDELKIDASMIELEITETSFSEVDANSVSILGKLQQMGISLALDDFGTGYSAFHHIEHYPVDTLKIDKSFIDRYHLEKNNKVSVISAMIAIAHSNGLKVIAEGVETREQADYLTSLGCDMLQGYYFSKPISEAQYLEALD